MIVILHRKGLWDDGMEGGWQKENAVAKPPPPPVYASDNNINCNKNNNNYINLNISISNNNNNINNDLDLKLNRQESEQGIRSIVKILHTVRNVKIYFHTVNVKVKYMKILFQEYVIPRQCYSKLFRPHI